MGISFRGSVAQNDLLVQLRPEPGSESVELAIPIRNKLQSATKWLVGILMGVGHDVDLPHQLRVTKEVLLFHMVAAAIQLAGYGLADCVEINAIRFATPEIDVLLKKLIIGWDNPRRYCFRNQSAPGFQPTISGKDDNRKQILIHTITTKPLRNDDVHLFREFEGLHVILQDIDPVAKAILRHNALREFRNMRPFNGIDHSGPRLRCKQTENAGTGAYVEHRAAWCHRVDNGSAKRLASDRISQHRLMTPEIAVIDFKWHLSSFSIANVSPQELCSMLIFRFGFLILPDVLRVNFGG